jgi:hypothetical protein
MLIGDARGSHVVLRAELEADRADADAWVSVDVRLEGFLVGITSGVARSDWDAFLQALGRLEETRSGEAVVRSADGSELYLRIFANGSAGHVAVEGGLSRLDLLGAPVFRFGAVEFDPTSLPGLLRELRDIGGPAT